MLANLTVGKRIALGFGIALTLMAGLGAVGYWGTQSL